MMVIAAGPGPESEEKRKGDDDSEALQGNLLVSRKTSIHRLHCCVG